jgi:hypothetical protein
MHADRAILPERDRRQGAFQAKWWSDFRPWLQAVSLPAAKGVRQQPLIHIKAGLCQSGQKGMNQGLPDTP